MKTAKIILSLTACAFIAACANDDVQYSYPEPIGDSKYDSSGKKPDSIFGEDGFTLFGGSSKKDDSAAGTSIGVNSFLWRASLDTLSFMPLSSADPFGGVIITDWYTPPDVPNERFKINAFIMTKALRSDGIKISVFKQIKNEQGDWIDATVPSQMKIKLEDAILTRARELRIAQMPSN